MDPNSPAPGAAQEEELPQDPAPIEDSYTANLQKGPDPQVWDESNSFLSVEDSLYDPDNPASEGPLRLEIGEILDEGTEYEIKGPGPEWAAHLEETGGIQ